jgi:4-hydroxyphenylpyruvate dioxygenase
MTADKPTTILWAGTVRAHQLEDRVAAAAAGGYDEMSVAPTDVSAELAAGSTFADLRALQRHYGVRLSHLDPLTRWAPRWRPDPAAWDGAAGMTGFLGSDPDTFLFWAEQLGAASVSAIVSADLTGVDGSDLAAAFARTADLAAGRGLRVDLEFIPFWGLPDLRTAWEVVDRARRPNTGIVLDTWHFFRGDPDTGLLERLPPGTVTGVQIGDAGPPAPGLSAVQDCLENRVTPGEGEFPLVDLLSRLRRHDQLSRVGPEVFSTVYDALPAAVATARATVATARLLEAAGVPHTLRPPTAVGPAAGVRTA